MRKYLKYIFPFVCVIFITHSITAKNSSIDRFAEVVDSLHNSMVFPYNVAPGIVLTNIGVDKKDKMLVINYTLNPEFVESVIKTLLLKTG